MTPVLHDVLRLDLLVVESVQALRWGPATVAFLLLSAWWVKGPILVGLGVCADLRCRKWVPLAAVGATLATLAATASSTALKALFGRPRPPLADSGIVALGSLPSTSSFPSGHAATAFAAATVVAILHPRLRIPAFGIAALVGLSRVYLGVHYALDVLAGAALGILLGVGVAWAIRRVSLRRPPAVTPAT